MTGPRSFDSVGLVLHMPRQKIDYLLPRLDVGNMFTSRETDWKPLTRSTEEITLAFGRRGLKRVMAFTIVPQLFKDGLMLSSCTHEYRSVRVGAETVWKESLLFQFDRRLTPKHTQAVDQLHRFVNDHCWKRARVLTQRSQGRAYPELAIIELVQPMPLDTQRKCEGLDYSGTRGIWSHRIPPLTSGFVRKS